MPRLTREQNRMLDQAQRHVITVRPATVAGGFLPLAALAPFAAAAGVPLASAAGRWLGKKLFGTGVKQAGAGILRAGDRQPHILPVNSNIRGSGRSNFRAGDYMMPAMQPLMNYRTGSQTGMQGGMLLEMPGVPDKVKNIVRKMSVIGGKKKRC